MKGFFADLHVHVGMSEQGKWVKIPTSRHLTITNILAEAADRKGLAVIGVIDALSPLVLKDLSDLADRGLLSLCSGGGYRYLDKLTLLLGAEIETVEEGGGQSHTLIFLPDIAEMRRFSKEMAAYIRNINLSSQNAHMPLGRLIDIAGAYEAVIIPAHVFTPHKSLFGVCCKRLDAILSDRQMASIAAIELGLSADSAMADRMPDLAQFTFLSNSDAHSLDKIAREYNVLTMAEPSFTEFVKTCLRQDGRKVAANYGLDPRLGKYHRSCCRNCQEIVAAASLQGQCPGCGSKQLTKGVFDRIEEIAVLSRPEHPGHRPPYLHQIPLTFIPGIGKRGMEKLLADFGTEMNILHMASPDELTNSVGARLADCIAETRSGQARIVNGGGGIYGRVTR